MQKCEVVRARRKAEQDEMEGVDRGEIELEEEMYGPSQEETAKKPHTLSSVLLAMEQACADIEDEITAAEREADALFEDLQSTVGDLSDLRYGKFSQPLGSGSDVRTEVLESLQGLEDTCRSAMGT